MTGPGTPRGRPAPPIDPRGRPELVADAERLAQLFSAWRPPAGGTDLGRALIAVFAGMAEEVVRRLNAVPDRDFLAFLELLGVEPLPARAATVPLTFTLPPGSAAVAFVPGGTPAAAPTPGGTPARFFTERDLVVSPAVLAAAVVLEPAADRWADVSAAADGFPGPSWAAFAGDSQIEHALYVTVDEFAALPRPRSLGVAVRFPSVDAVEAFGAVPLEWSRWDGGRWEELLPVRSDTQGTVRAFDLGDVAAPEPTVVGGHPGRWLRARLRRAIGTVPQLARVTVAGVDVTVVVAAGNDALPDAGLAGALPVDLSGDVHPFGEQPRFTDSFSLASPVFGRPQAQVTVTVTISPGLARPPAPSAGTVLVWEVGGADRWTEVGRSGPGAPAPIGSFTDGTAAFTTDGEVRFTVPATGGPLVLGGVSGWWLRVRIAAGDYGTAAAFRPSPDPAHGPALVPATFAPPALAQVRVRWQFQGQQAAATLLAVNGDDVEDHTAAGPAFVPFLPVPDDRPALHLGFDRAFPDRPALLYPLVDASPPGGAAPPGGAPLRWEYALASGWTDLRAVDETRGLTRSAPVAFLGPPDLLPTRHFGRSLCWLRVRPAGPGPAVSPLLRGMLTNTVPATAAVSAPAEVLGTSDGSVGQAFGTTRRPVLDGERLEVLAGSGWEAWQRVPDFAASGPLDHHYLLDRDLGEVRFGNGRRAAIPPAGAAVRATYASGGGSADNRPAQAVTQLEVALAGVDRVTNHVPAAGGADPEPVERVRVRGPLGLRHGGRAVAAEDYADLAATASPDVARALAVPVPVNPLDVAWIHPAPVDPAPEGPLPDGSVLCAAPAGAVPTHSPPSAGRVTVTVVPESGDVRPAPSRQLLDEVADELRARCPSVVAEEGLTVVGPVWIEVTVRATVAVADPQTAQTLPAAVTAALDRFLHPLHGGPDGGGWAFGRAAHRSDLLALVAALPGADHVVRLDLAEDPDRGGLPPEDLARALVWSGTHEVAVVPAGEPA